MSLPIILASSSKIRQKILSDAAVPYQAVTSDVDEAALKAAHHEARNGGVEIDTLVIELAAAKAKAVSHLYTDHLVLGCDQILGLDGVAYDKAKDMEEAKARLRKFRGRTHQLIGGYTLYHGDALLWSHVSTVNLKMRDFSEEFLADYLKQSGEGILSSVACYKIEKMGAQLMEAWDQNLFAVMGMDLMPVLNALRQHGGLAA